MMKWLIVMVMISLVMDFNICVAKPKANPAPTENPDWDDDMGPSRSPRSVPKPAGPSRRSFLLPFDGYQPKSPIPASNNPYNGYMFGVLLLVAVVITCGCCFCILCLAFSSVMSCIFLPKLFKENNSNHNKQEVQYHEI